MLGVPLNKVALQLLEDARREILIVETGNKVIVGPYVVEQKGGLQDISIKGVYMTTFNTRKAAIAYTISELNRTVNLSESIRRHDDRIGKYMEDILYYKLRVIQSQNKEDWFKERLYLNRIDQANTEIEILKRSMLRVLKQVRIT